MPTIQKWGNELAVRIPSAIAEQLYVRDGTPIDIHSENGRLVIIPQRALPRYHLKDLLKNCKPGQLHGETDFGPDVGREVLDP